MSTIQEQIEAIEKEIRETPYHKATEHHVGRLRAKLTKLKEKIYFTDKKGKGGGGRRLGGASGSERGYSVKKQGDATVVLVGPPSVGKSTLLNQLTNAKSKIAPYDFTTVTVIPGMMEYKDAQIQILDVPGLIEGAEEGKGRGREVLSVARASNLLIIMCDVNGIRRLDSMIISLEKVGIRINQVPPKINIEKKVKGGLIIHSNIRQDLGEETVKEVANELGIKNAEITIKEKLSLENLIDAFSPNRIYVPAVFIINKIDLNIPLQKKLDIAYHPISAGTGFGLDKLKEKIWEKLGFIRIYLIKQDEKPTLNHPIIVKSGDNLGKITEKIGSEFAQQKKLAKIWGPGSKYPGQEVSLTTKVVEGMQIRFI